jgi:hypothetical protein
MASDSTGTDDTKLRTNRTFICSVVFLDIVEYSKKPVVEQMSLKERFNDILAESLKDISISDRIILDTGDGAAIGFLSDPEDALFVAMSIRDALNIEQEKSDMRVRMGINLGPVKILKDINKQMNLIGDGINVAQRIMSFAEPGQLLVSRSYYDIVSCLSQEYAKLFQYKGAKADKHIREHDIYAVENAGLLPTSSSHYPVRKIDPDSAKPETSSAIETPLFIEVDSGPVLDAGAKRSSIKKMLLIGVPFAIIILVAAGFFLIPRSQDKSSPDAVLSKSSSSARMAKATRAQKAEAKAEETRAAEKKAEEKNDSYEETFKSSSVKADGIEFTLAGVKRVGAETILSVRMRNTSGVAKSVALYDDYVNWPKSKLTDQNGKNHNVNKVVFVKGSRTITSQNTGTQGLMLNSSETASVSLTFRKTGKGIKEFALHPFIYIGRNWKEHDLPLKVEF